MTRSVLETCKHGTLRLEAVVSSAGSHQELYRGNRLQDSTAFAHSSALLADLALAGIGAHQRHAEVLMGGLGAGLVLRRILQNPAIRMVCVVEPFIQVVTWNRVHLGNSDWLDDPRVELVVGDFFDYVQGAPRNYNGIALRPETALAENRRALSLSLLGVLRLRLRSGGALALIAREGHPSIERALAEVFDQVSVKTVSDDKPDGSALTSAVYQAYL